MQPLDVLHLVRQCHDEVTLVAEIGIEVALANAHDLLERIRDSRLSGQRVRSFRPESEHAQQHRGIDTVAVVGTLQIRHHSRLGNLGSVIRQASQQP